MLRSHATIAGIALGAFALSFEPTANAASSSASKADKKKAAKLAKDGEKDFAGKHYNDALKHFTDAFLLAPSPSLMKDISSTQLHLGRCTEAMAKADDFASAVPGNESSKWLSEVKNSCPTVDVTSDPPGAKLWVDGANGASVGTTPWSGRLHSGDHMLIAKLDGCDDARTEIAVQPGVRAQAKLVLLAPDGMPPLGPLAAETPAASSHVDLNAVAPAHSAPAGPPMEAGKVAGWTTFAIGAAAVVGGAVIGGLALSQKAALGKANQTIVTSPAQAGTVIGGINTQATASVFLLGAGGAAAAAGATLLIVF